VGSPATCRLPRNANRAALLLVRSSDGSDEISTATGEQIDAASEEETSTALVKAGVSLSASRAFAIEVEEGERTLAEYVTLPAKKYSVLDSDAVQSIGDNTFRVSGGQQKFLMGQSGTPVGIIQIEVGEDRVVQRLVEAKIENAKGRAMVEVNRLMGQLQMSTTVSVMSNPDDPESKMIKCEVGLAGAFTDGVMSKIPQDKLNQLVSTALGVVVPWFLSQLKQDYLLWVDGNQKERGQLGKGQMKVMTTGMLNTLKTGTLPEGVREA